MCPTRGAVFRGCFAGGEDINLLFIYFEGFNEGMIRREAEMRGSMVKCGTGQLEGGGRICAISVRISMNKRQKSEPLARFHIRRLNMVK